MKGLLKISRDYPDIQNLRDHLRGNTSLSVYLSEVSRAFRKDIVGAGRYISFSEDRDLALLPMVAAGTAEVLFKFRLAEKLGLDFLDHPAILRSLRKLTDFLNRMTEAGLDSLLSRRFGEMEFRKLCRMVETTIRDGFDYFGDGEIERSLFVFQILRFEKYGTFDVFEKNWLSVDFFAKEVEIMAERAMGKIGDFFTAKDMDFFPEFGDSSELAVSGDLLAGDRLLNFCSGCREEILRRQALILKACRLLDTNKKIKRTFVYGMRDGKMIEFTY